jgi:hypothetical protein
MLSLYLAVTIVEFGFCKSPMLGYAGPALPHVGRNPNPVGGAFECLS